MTEWFLIALQDDWRIPTYAQDMLWVAVNDRPAVQTNDYWGQFELDLPDGDILLRLLWGGPHGPALAQWARKDLVASGTVGWSGEVAIGGFVERLHAMTVGGLDIVIASIEGAALPPGYTRLPDLDQMRTEPFLWDDVPVGDEHGVHNYTVIVQTDAPQAEYLHHALVSELAVDCWGALGPQAGDWHAMVGMPILLDAVTLLAPKNR